MGYPAEKMTRSKALETVDAACISVLVEVREIRQQVIDGPVTRKRIAHVLPRIRFSMARWAEVSSKNVQGLRQYAREQKDEPTLDIKSDLLLMQQAAMVLRDWVNANIPVDDADLTLISDAQRAEFRIQAEAFIATIE